MNKHFKVPLRGEEPSEELMNFLHNDCIFNWDGDDEGIIFMNDIDHQTLQVFPGDEITVLDNGELEVMGDFGFRVWENETN